MENKQGYQIRRKQFNLKINERTVKDPAGTFLSIHNYSSGLSLSLCVAKKKKRRTISSVFDS